MDVSTYQKISTRTWNDEEERRHQIANAALGLCGEAGETADYIKKFLYHGHPFSVDEMVKELGDVAYYLATLATLFHLDLGEILQANADKLRTRYPDGFSTRDSLNRRDVAGT